MSRHFLTIWNRLSTYLSSLNLTFFKSISHFLVYWMSLDLCLSGVESRLDSGCAFAQNTRKWSSILLVHHIRGSVILSVPWLVMWTLASCFRGCLTGFWRCPWCGCFAGWLLGGQGPGEDLCVPQLLACFFPLQFSEFPPLGFFYHAVSRECPLSFLPCFPQIVALYQDCLLVSGCAFFFFLIEV